LRRAIASVLDQDMTDVEVVVADDSGDLEPVVREFRDERLVYICNNPRRGMVANWSFLLDRSRSGLLGLLMDDDQLLPGFLTAVTRCFDGDPALGLVFTDHLFSNGDSTWPRSCEFPGGRHVGGIEAMIRCRPVAISASVMRRDVWEAVRPLPDILTADLVMHLRIVSAGYPIYYINRPLMTYAVHDTQQSYVSPKFRQDQVSAWESFAFDGAAERLRRRQLARALVSVAAAQMSDDDVPAARESLRRARALGRVNAGQKAAALSALASNAALTRKVLQARRMWKRLR
jgi:glycosyltransferase involved in cell wall biosynthesis